MDISIIGTGAMGAALARALLNGGVNVTAWNRSIDKARALEPLGAKVEPDLSLALSASPNILICIDNYAICKTLFEDPKIAAILTGRSILQFSTGTPSEAAEFDAWVRAQGAKYLDGAIMVYPADIGTDAAQILVCGPRDEFDKWEPALRLLSKELRYVGAAASASATLDMALLSRLIGLKFGAIYGAHICEAADVDVAHYAALMQDGDPAKTAANVIASGDFTLGGGSGSVDVALGCVERIQSTAKSAGIDSELPDLFVNYYKRASENGFSGKCSSAVITAMRANAQQSS
ncbi:MAG: NAD(P)-dependent oxidoreductase [Boseongicola sp.]